MVAILEDTSLFAKYCKIYRCVAERQNSRRKYEISIFSDQRPKQHLIQMACLDYAKLLIAYFCRLTKFLIKIKVLMMKVMNNKTFKSLLLQSDKIFDKNKSFNNESNE